MRRLRHGASSLLAIAGLTVLAAPAGAASRAPAATAANGGAAYGTVPLRQVAPPAAHVSLSPRRVTAGKGLPKIGLEVYQRGEPRVTARLVVLRVSDGAPVARINLGRTPTGKVVTARWPAGLTLPAGQYLVRAHAKDELGRSLRRPPGRLGKAMLTVVAPPPVLAAPLAGGAPIAAGLGVFPVAGRFDFGGAANRFGAARDGHIHQGQDILAAEGTPVVSPFAGTITSTDYQASAAGEYVVLDGADGRDYFFAHCIRHSTVVAPGAVVAPGQQLCSVGQTGDATTPHLHFEIWMVGWRVPGGYPIDPLPELQAWAGMPVTAKPVAPGVAAPKK